MSDIKRYELEISGLHEKQDGSLIEYDDHAKVIKDKCEEIRQLIKMVENQAETIEAKDKEIDLRNDWIKKRDEYALSLLQRIEADSIEIQRLKNEVCDE